MLFVILLSFGLIVFILSLLKPNLPISNKIVKNENVVDSSILPAETYSNIFEDDNQIQKNLLF